MAEILDPKVQKEFLSQRKQNNRLSTDKEKENKIYLDLSEKSGLSPITLKQAAYGKNDDAFIQVASSEELSNKEKNLILSGSAGKFHIDTEVTKSPTFTFTKTWKTPVKKSICSRPEGYTSHKCVKTFGGRVKYKDIKTKAKITNVDWRGVKHTNDISDLIARKIQSPNIQLSVTPVDALNYLKYLE